MEKKNLNFTKIYKDTNESEKIIRDCAEVNSKTFYSRLLTDNGNDVVKK